MINIPLRGVGTKDVQVTQTGAYLKVLAMMIMMIMSIMMMRNEDDIDQPDWQLPKVDLDVDLLFLYCFGLIFFYRCVTFVTKSNAPMCNRVKQSRSRMFDHNDVYDDNSDCDGDDRDNHYHEKVTFSPFYYEVKLSQPVKPNGRFVFTSSGLSVELEKTEEGLWGEQC